MKTLIEQIASSVKDSDKPLLDVLRLEKPDDEIIHDLVSAGLLDFAEDPHNDDQEIPQD